jgi:uncharacterized membrane protein
LFFTDPHCLLIKVPPHIRTILPKSKRIHGLSLEDSLLIFSFYSSFPCWASKRNFASGTILLWSPRDRLRLVSKLKKLKIVENTPQK